jgi:hypothetical protein
LSFADVVPRNIEYLTLNDGFSNLNIRILMAERFWEPCIFRKLEEYATQNGVEFKIILSDDIARRNGFTG